MKYLATLAAIALLSFAPLADAQAQAGVQEYLGPPVSCFGCSSGGFIAAAALQHARDVICGGPMLGCTVPAQYLDGMGVVVHVRLSGTEGIDIGINVWQVEVPPTEPVQAYIGFAGYETGYNECTDWIDHICFGGNGNWRLCGPGG